MDNSISIDKNKCISNAAASQLMSIFEIKLWSSKSVTFKMLKLIRSDLIQFNPQCIVMYLHNTKTNIRHTFVCNKREVSGCVMGKFLLPDFNNQLTYAKVEKINHFDKKKKI